MSNSSLFEVSTNTQDETGCQCGRKQLRPGKIQIFFSNIFKIKDKILINFSVSSHTASWSHQNIKIRIKELIHTFLTGFLYTFNWIHFLKWIVICSNFFPVFYTLWQHRKHICDTIHAVAFITQSKQLMHNSWRAKKAL